MIKNSNGKETHISKEDYLDEMLHFPSLESDHDYDTLNTTYTLETPYRFENLIKRIAAKIFSEEELLEILGDEGKNWYETNYYRI